MVYIYGDRNQVNMFPESIEDYVAKDDPVRAYGAFVESLELNELGIRMQEVKVGNPSYNPRTMISLLVYGYSYGIRSSRKLERACYHNISFMWLTGGLKPDHKTIAEFRRKNKRPLKKVLKQSAILCIKLGLIEGNTLFVDGSKIRGNASINSTWTKDKCDRYMEKIDERIRTILKECDSADDREGSNPSLVKLTEELNDKEKLKTKVEEIMKELKRTGKEKINSTDPECVNVKGRQGIHAGYNGQIVVDEKHGLIVNSDVVNESNDTHQFDTQITQANETLGRKCKNACGDAGYSCAKELKKVDNKGINIVVPSQEQASKREASPFNKDKFSYNKEDNSYKCPEGYKLTYDRCKKKRGYNVYSITDKSICFKCKHFGVCTSSKNGRSIERHFEEEVKQRVKENYEKKESQAIYDLRKQKVELPFGHIKRNLGVTAFLLRGIDGVKAEMSLMSSCFNITRMTTIFGVEGFIERIMGV